MEGTHIFATRYPRTCCAASVLMVLSLVTVELVAMVSGTYTAVWVDAAREGVRKPVHSHIVKDLIKWRVLVCPLQELFADPTEGS